MARLDDLRQRIATQAAPLLARIEPARDWWERASQRDRRLAMVLGATVLALICLGIVTLASNALDSERSAVAKTQGHLDRVDEMAQQHKDLKREVQNLKSRTVNDPVATFVEKRAGVAGITGAIDRIQNQRTDEGDFFEESVVEVRLKKISLSKLTKFMHAVEHSGQAARVQSLEAKPTFQDPRYLDVNLEIVGYRKLEGG